MSKSKKQTEVFLVVEVDQAQTGAVERNLCVLGDFSFGEVHDILSRENTTIHAVLTGGREELHIIAPGRRLKVVPLPLVDSLRKSLVGD